MYEAHLYSLNLDTSLFLYMSSISSCEPISFCDFIYIYTLFLSVKAGNLKHIHLAKSSLYKVQHLISR